MLAVVSVHFNPCGYVRPEQNFCIFANHLASQGVALYAAELAFGDKQFRLPPVGREVLRLRGNSILWQKERLLNHVVSQLPPEYDKICFADADILFVDNDWAAKLSRLLDVADVVQPFDNAIYLPPGENVVNLKHAGKPSSFANRLRGLNVHDDARGLAWAFRRDFLNRVDGLYDRGILGGGDTFLSWGVWNEGHPAYTPGMNEDLFKYLRKFQEEKPRPAFLEGTVCHLFHGSSSNRRYMDRYEIAAKHQYDPAYDIKQENGIWSWSSNKPEFHAEVAEYFMGRKEDEKFLKSA